MNDSNRSPTPAVRSANTVSPADLSGTDGTADEAATPLKPDSELAAQSAKEPKVPATEHGGADGPEPTRYGDWERRGRCIDF